MDLKINLLLSDQVFLNRKEFLDSPGKVKQECAGEFSVGLVNKNSKSSKRILAITKEAILVKKCEKIEKKTLINKIKLFVQKGNQCLEIPVKNILGVKHNARVNSLEITFNVKKKNKYIIIEAESAMKKEEIYSSLSSLINLNTHN